MKEPFKLRVVTKYTCVYIYVLLIYEINKSNCFQVYTGL